MSRLAALLLAALLVTGPAVGQTAAPGVDPGTRIAFPPSIAGTTLTRSNGSTYEYTAPNGIGITVDVYDNGRRVPNGSSHPTIINQFTEELANTRQQAESAGMRNFEKPSVPSACTYGPWNLRCINFSASGGSATGRIYGKLMLIGYRDHFVKIIAHWSQTGGQTNADADKLLTAFVPALLH
ncbi:MAG: hypothetical protein JSS04_21250 [Proteobacteria bacterium]|nr:hypothetical protein [Pseudomonadota bacterium]